MSQMESQSNVLRKATFDSRVADFWTSPIAPDATERIFPDGFSQSAVFYPLGFPLRVLSNSSAVLDAAHQSWGSFSPLFHREPLELRIGVKHGAAQKKEELPPSPEHAFKGNFLMNVADSNNFTVVDLKRGRAVGWVTEATAASPLYLRYFYIEAAALSMITSLHAVALHGACVRLESAGVLLCGDSGVGKTTLAYGGSRAGWTYVCDDSSYLPVDRDDRLVVGNCHRVRFRPSAAELFPEVSELPITPRSVGKPSIEVSTSELRGIRKAGLADIDHIVFLKRGTGEKRDLVPLSASEVRPWFQQHLLPNPASMASRESALSRLLKATISELRYQDLDWAIDRINQLSQRGY